MNFLTPDMRTANFKFSCDVYREGVYYIFTMYYLWPGRSHLALVRSGRGSLVHAALYRLAPLRSVRELQEKRSEEEHSCQKRAGLHLTTSELPTDLICSPAWPVDTRNSSLSRKTPRSKQRSRNPKATTRRLRRKRRWCSRVASAGRKCQIPRPSSSILRASTLRTLFPQSWRAWRREQPRTPEVDCIKHHNKSPDLTLYSAGQDQRSYLSFIHASSPSLQT